MKVNHTNHNITIIRGRKITQSQKRKQKLNDILNQLSEFDFFVCTSMLKVFVHFELKNNSWNKSFLRKKLLESFIFKFEKKRQEVTVAEIIPNMLSINDKLDSSVWFQKVLFFETFSSNFKSVESSFLLNLKNLSNIFYPFVQRQSDYLEESNSSTKFFFLSKNR